MIQRKLFNEVRAFLQAKADAAQAQRWARYFTEGYDAYGVDYKDPEWKALQDKWAERFRTGPPAVWLEAVDPLVRSGKYEEASFAVLMAIALEEHDSPEVWNAIGGWFDGGIRNWGHTDVLCSECLARCVLTGAVPLKSLVEWRKSPHKYQRRAVPVTMVKLLKTAKDFKPFFRAIEPLMHDEERVVQQGLGWFLREAWKKQPGPSEEFLLRYKETCPRLIVQYATERMDAAGKTRFRRSQKVRA